MQLHRRLLEAGLDDAITAALRHVPGKDRRDYRDALRGAGVDALGGRLVEILARAVEVIPPEGPPGPDDQDVVDEAIEAIARLGGGHYDLQPTPASDVIESVPPLLADCHAPEATPTVAVRLGVGWAGRRRQQRADVLEYLVRLGAVVDLDLVATSAAAVRLLEDHADLLPAHCLTKLRNHRRGVLPRDGPGSDRDAADVARDARASLSPHGRPTAVLRHVRRSPTHSLTYDALARELALDEPPYESARRLDGHGLVDRLERADGATVVSLRPAGASYLRLLESEQASDGGLSPSSSGGAPSSSGSGSGVSHGPQNRADMPCYPPAWDPPRTPTPAPPDEDGERPPSEAESAADGDRRDRYHEGYTYPRYATRMDWLPAVEAVDQGEVALVDADLLDRLDEDRNGLVPLVSYDADRDEVYVAAEHHNPMQYAVALAHGLASEELLATDEWADRIGEDLRGLEIHERAMLWSGACMGWLPAEVEDGEDYLAELRDARDELCRLSGQTREKGGDVGRGTVTRMALGLIGTMVDLYDLLGVDVVLEARVPTFSRDFGESRREDLVDHLGTLAAMTSRAGGFSAFRQLFERREDHRSDAFNPGFEASKHGYKGSMRAGIVVVGDGVERLADDLEDALANPRPVHEDAPPISIPIDLRVGTDRERFGSTIKRMLRESRNLQPTPAATMVLRAFSSSPWAATEAIHWGLEREPERREVDLYECRRALAQLGAHRLLGGAAPSARGAVATLLKADEPLPQTELAARAGISTDSWRTHREGLVAADVVREVEDGWRVALPFRSERWDDVDVANPPWYLLAGDRAREQEEYCTADPHARKMTEVLWWLYERGAISEDRMQDPDDPIGRAVVIVEKWGHSWPRGAVDRATADAALEQLGIPPGLVQSGCWWWDPPPSTAVMGASTTQQPLPI